MKSSKRILATGLMGASLFVVGCSSTPSYDVGLQSEVETRIDAAINNGAEEYAPLALHDAREKLQTAEQLISSGDEEAAQYWLEKASVDAELAAARANSERAKYAADQIDKDIQTLRGKL